MTDAEITAALTHLAAQLRANNPNTDAEDRINDQARDVPDWQQIKAALGRDY